MMMDVLLYYYYILLLKINNLQQHTTISPPSDLRCVQHGNGVLRVDVPTCNCAKSIAGMPYKKNVPIMRLQLQCVTIICMAIVVSALSGLVFMLHRRECRQYSKMALVLATKNTDPLPPRSNTVGKGRYAYATLVISKPYLPGAKLLACSLTKVGARYPLVVFVGKSFLKEARHYYSGVENIEVRPIRLISTMNKYQRRFGFIFTKLNLFGEEDFERLIVTDADNTYKKNVDKLFTRDLEHGFAMAKINSDKPEEYLEGKAQYSQASANFIVLTPNKNILKDMLKKLKANVKLRFQQGFAEQMFLQWYFYLYMTWLPTFYSVTASESMARTNNAIVLHHSRKPFFRMYRGYVGAIPDYVRSCMKIHNVTLDICENHNCDDISYLKGTELPSKADQDDALNLDSFN